ncbi:MAG TPA: hypothetical protein VGI66_07455 [Streptosporangiaceae bacterium]
MSTKVPPVAGSTAAVLAAATGTRSLSPATYPSWAGRLDRVAATSANDVWAVGLSAAGGQIAHWNGRSWSDYDFSDGYQAVAARSPTDVWAVGGTAWFYPSQTFAEHWNGKAWTHVPTPTPGGSAYLNGVAATSPANAWTVGCICGGPGAPGIMVPLIEHWNGKTWRRQSFNLPQNSGEFNDVAAISATDAWAVGTTSNGTANGALIEHWNGTRWKRVWPGTGNGRGVLQGVTATGPDNVWAAGFNDNGPTYLSLILHFNGKRWSPVPSPNPTGSTNLWDISASSPTNAWAVGFTNPNVCGNGGPQCGTAAFHWNGKTWRAVPAPNPSAGLDALSGVVAMTPSDAWAVGAVNSSSTIIEHWNGKAWNT